MPRVVVVGGGGGGFSEDRDQLRLELINIGPPEPANTTNCSSL